MNDTLLWIQRLLAIGLLIQTGELFFLRKDITTIWDWPTLSQDFPAWLRRLLAPFLANDQISLLLGLQMLAALGLLVFPEPIFIWILFATTLMINLRFRGTFNGGSDFMTLLILYSLGAVSLFDLNVFSFSSETRSKALFAGLSYIGVQAVLSYFIAGVIKLKNSDWRNGQALTGFLELTIYPQPRILTSLHFNAALGWLVLLFECTFPLALLHPFLCLIYLGLGFLFHLGNAFCFGLNRFTWAWLASYPAILFLCAVLHQDSRLEIISSSIPTAKWLSPQEHQKGQRDNKAPQAEGSDSRRAM